MNVWTKLPQGLSTKLGKGVLTAKKFSPETLTVIGIASVVTSTVLIARATLKAQPVIADIRLDIDSLKNARDEDNAKELNQAIVKRYAAGSLDLAKVYLPGVTLGVAGIGCFLGAHGIMKRRNVALAAAYKVAEGTIAEYKKRLVEELGEEKAEEVTRGIVTEETKDEAGKLHKTSRIDAERTSMYARCFAKESSTEWEPEATYNLMFLRSQQAYFNNILHHRGYVYLNEVYKALGFEPSRAGQVVGWKLGANQDNHIDFGIYDADSQEKRMFVNGDEKSIWLDFNVSGTILDVLKDE